MTDIAIDALLEAVRLLIEVQNLHEMPEDAVLPVVETLGKIRALIAQRKGKD